MDQNDQIEARYVILTQSILGNKELTSSDKLVLARISGFERFFEANEKTAEFLGLSERTVREAKSRLLELGYIIEIANTGHGKIYAPDLHRVAKIADQTGRNCLSDRQNLPPENKDRLNCRLNNVDTNVSTGAEAPADEEKKAEEQPATYGRDDINEIVDLWEQETGTSIKGDKNERRQIYNLIRKHGAERTKALVRAVGDIRRNGDRFAPQIATPRELTGKYSKLGRLEIWMERKSISRPFGTQEKPLTPCPDYALPPRDLPAYGGAFEIQSDEEREKVAKMMAEKRKTLPFMKKKEADNE